MSKSAEDEDDLLPEYDLTVEQLKAGVKGKYAARFAEGVNLVKLDADVARMFPDSESVNEALRALIKIIDSRVASRAA
jgi:hypothetical protein